MTISSSVALLAAVAATAVVIAVSPDRKGPSVVPTAATQLASCPQRAAHPDVKHLREGAAKDLVPSEAGSADMCRYSGLNDGQPGGRLLESARLTPNATAQLVELLDKPAAAASSETVKTPATPQIVHCGPDDGSAATITFTYPSGPPVVVSVSLTGCRGVTNGTVSQQWRYDIDTWVAERR